MSTEDIQKSELYDAILDFKLLQIPSYTRFWMVRTKKGYFYKEFINRNYVALAWNTITSDTSFSDATSDALGQEISDAYPEIKRPKLVINKCKSFILDIKPGDILIIPSLSSRLVTFAYAGEYYEDDQITYEDEISTIQKIESKEVLINEVSCPYKKRRSITIIRTVRGEELNYHLYKAISSYHGITNLDSYAEIILDHLYNCYSYNNTTRLVFHVGKPGPITSREFSGFLYSVNSILCAPEIDEMAISAQASVHSIGDIVFSIKEIYNWFSNNYLILIAIAAVIGGGKFLTVELPGIPSIIKDFISIKNEKARNEAELTKLQLENLEKALEIEERLKQNGVSSDQLIAHLQTLNKCKSSMQIKPIASSCDPSLLLNDEVEETDDAEEES